MEQIVDVSFKEVNEALALVEQFELLKEDLASFSKSLPEKYKVEAEIYSSRLSTLVAILDSDIADDFDSLANKPLSGRITKSSIERLGLSQELIKARKDCVPINELATRFGVGSETVSRFFRYYDKLKPSDKVKLQKKSVFDTVEQLEELAVLIKRNIARLEGQDDETNVRLIGELRQTIMSAANLAEKMANYEKYERFTQQVIKVLQNELPAKRTLILKEINAAQRMATQSPSAMLSDKSN